MRRKWEKVRVICFAFSVILTVMAIAGVSYLTGQTGSETLSTQARVVAMFPFAFQQHHHNWIWLHLGLNSPRRLAHVYEFGFLGACATLAMLTNPWPRRGRSHLSYRRVSVRMLLSVALCAAMSFMDQVHKIFVQYRHFDVLDLRLDAIGYVGMALVVSVLYLLVTRRALQKTERLLEEQMHQETYLLERE